MAMATSPDRISPDLTEKSQVALGQLLSVQTATIHQIAGFARSTVALDEALQTMAQQWRNALGVSGCLIFLPERSQQPIVAVGGAAPLCPECLLSQLYHESSAWLARGQAVRFPDCQHLLSPKLWQWAIDSNLGAIWIEPIRQERDCHGGVMLYQWGQAREWTPQEIDCISAIAAGCAIALMFEGRDITDDKQAQVALQVSAARNRAILDAIPDVIFRISRHGIYLEWQATNTRVLPVADNEIVGKHLHQILPTDVAGLIWECIEQALETHQIQIAEYQLWFNGKPHYFEARIASSGVDEVVMVVQDVTERVEARLILQQVNDALESRVEQRTSALQAANHDLRAEIVERHRAEQQLRQSEEQFRQLTENIHEVFFLTTPDLSEMLYISPAYADVWGRTTESLYKQPISWLESVHPLDRDRVTRALEQQIRGEQDFNQEYRIVRPDRSIRWVWVRAFHVPHEAGTVARIAGIAEDITERKQAEAQIRFVHSVTEAIFETEDFRTALAVALQKVCETTDWDFGEAWVPRTDGTQMECSCAWYGDEAPLEQFHQISQTLTFSPGMGIPGRVWVAKQPEWQADVSTLPESVYLRTPLARQAGLKAALGIPILADDEVLAVLVFYMFEARDKDQRSIELISASTKLGLMIQRKRAEGNLREALEKEKELTELKSRFITMTSHEFRTPLTTIQSSAELLEHYSYKWTQEKKLGHLHRIQASVAHMTKLLNDVLIIGKADAGKLKFNPLPLDLENFCWELTEELQLNDPEGHAIILTCDRGLGHWALGMGHGENSFPCLDGELLRQILENLLSNAMKYSPSDRPIELTFRYNPVALESKEAQVVFQIRDRGIGIPPEDKQRLFETFHRAQNVGTIAGTGLGLAIVKKCVEIHQGQIAIDSEVGVGTTVTVTLPISAQGYGET